MISNKVLNSALGPRDLDYIELHNAWAKVTIRRYIEGGPPTMYCIFGDVVIDDRNTPQAYAHDIAQAYKIALESLAAFERGRAD